MGRVGLRDGGQYLPFRVFEGLDRTMFHKTRQTPPFDLYNSFHGTRNHQYLLAGMGVLIVPHQIEDRP